MLGFNKRFAAAVAAIAIFGGGVVVSADTVSFTTTGAFNGTMSNSFVFTNGATPVATITFGPGGALINNINAGDTVSLNTFGGQSFGSFAVTFDGSPVPSGFTETVPFALSIDQTSPTVGSGTSNGSVKGDINVSDLSGVFTATFVAGASSTTIGSIVYQPATTIISGTGVGATPLGGTVSETPLPATASTGLIMLAGLGGLVGLRKLTGRRNVVA